MSDGKAMSSSCIDNQRNIALKNHFNNKLLEILTGFPLFSLIIGFLVYLYTLFIFII